MGTAIPMIIIAKIAVIIKFIGEYGDGSNVSVKNTSGIQLNNESLRNTETGDSSMDIK